MVRILILSLAAIPLFAQTDASTPTFRSGTNLVEATAVVRDRENKPVGGLKADDFELFDSGKPQVISRFAVEKLERHPVQLIRNREAPPAAGPAPVVALPRRFVAYVIDDQNLVPEHFPLATLPAMRHLAGLQPGDRAAVRSASGRTILPFTDDREKLRHALSEMGSLGRRATFDVSALNSEITCRITYLKADWIRDGDPASLRNCVGGATTVALPPPVAQRPTGGVARGIPGEAHQIMKENEVRAFADSIVQAGDRDLLSYFHGLGELIDSMARMPGERTILLLSPGMYIPLRFRPLQDLLITEAVRAHVVISAVDPRGVYIRNDDDDPSTWTDTWGLAETRERNTFMDNVTSGTGGHYIRGNNDVEGALRRLEVTPEFLYLLGFSPSPLKLDGKFHPIKVNLKHGRGFTVDARRGYYAADAEPGETARAGRQVREVFFSDREFHDVPVHLQIRSSHKPDSITLTATASIDLSSVPFRKEDGANRLDLLLGIGLFDQNGNLVKDFWKDITLHPGDDALEAVRRAGLEVATAFEVTPGRYLLRGFLRDTSGGAMGTENMPVEIRP